MRTSYQHNGIVWVDLESPSREEVRQVVEQFDISSIVAEELLLPSTKPRADFFDAHVYVILHFPALRHSHKTLEQEVDFVVGRNFIITVRYDTVDPLHKFSKVFEVNSILNKSGIGEHAGFLFFYMMKKLYKSVEHEIEHVRKHLGTIEEHIFRGQEVRMVEAISQSARDLLNLRQTIEPHREVLRTLETEGVRLFGEDFSSYLRALSNEYYRVHNHIMRHTEALHELRETNNSLLTTKQNETMRVLTLMAFVTFPLSLIASIFSMDTIHEPIVGNQYDFWIILGIMGTSTLIMFWYFRHKKWL